MKLKNLCFAVLAAYSCVGTNAIHGAAAPALALQYLFGKSDKSEIANITPDLFIPEEKKEEIRKLFQEKGFKGVHFGNFNFFDDSKKSPNMSMNTESEFPTLRMNSAAAAVYRQDDPNITFTPDEVDAIVIHELGHAVHNHSNKKKLPPKLNITLSAMGALCIGYGYWALKQPSKDKLVHTLLTTAWSLVIQIHLYDHLNRPFQRNQEREADQFVLDGKDKKVITNFISGFEKSEIIDKKYLLYRLLPNWVFAHPTNEERIATARKALKEIEEVEKIEAQKAAFAKVMDSIKQLHKK